MVQARVEAEGLEEVVKGARAGPTEQEATRSGLSGLPEQSGLWADSVGSWTGADSGADSGGQPGHTSGP